MSTNVATRTKPKVTKYFGWQQAAALLTTVTVLWLAWQLRGSLEDLISYGYVGAFLAMFVSSATIILPAPGIVMVFAIAAAGANPILVGLFAGIGAGLGELVGYFSSSMYSWSSFEVSLSSICSLDLRPHRLRLWTHFPYASLSCFFCFLGRWD